MSASFTLITTNSHGPASNRTLMWIRKSWQLRAWAKAGPISDTKYNTE